MILVRDIFRLKFGRDQEAKELLKEGMEMISLLTQKESDPRLLADFAGPFNTLTLETTHESLAEYELSLAALMADSGYANWFQRLIPLMETGSREFHAVVK